MRKSLFSSIRLRSTIKTNLKGDKTYTFTLHNTPTPRTEPSTLEIVINHENLKSATAASFQVQLHCYIRSKTRRSFMQNDELTFKKLSIAHKLLQLISTSTFQSFLNLNDQLAPCEIELNDLSHHTRNSNPDILRKYFKDERDEQIKKIEKHYNKALQLDPGPYEMPNGALGAILIKLRQHIDEQFRQYCEKVERQKDLNGYYMYHQ